MVNLSFYRWVFYIDDSVDDIGAGGVGGVWEWQILATGQKIISVINTCV